LLYKFTVINNALLSSAASLGTYTQSHKTSQASKSFNIVFDRVIDNLDDAIAILNQDIDVDLNNTNTLTKENTNQSFIELKKIREIELRGNKNMDNDDLNLKMEEAQLVIEQLVWLTNISENIVKTSWVFKSS